jgi:hypothetical protein
LPNDLVINMIEHKLAEIYEVLENVRQNAKFMAVRRTNSTIYLAKEPLTWLNFGPIEDGDLGGLKLTILPMMFKFTEAGYVETATLLDEDGNEIWSELLEHPLPVQKEELGNLGMWKLEIVP